MLLHTSENVVVFEDPGADLTLMALIESADLEIATTNLVITGRPLSDYQGVFVDRNITKHAGQHVIEVGAGLGGLIPALVAIQSPGDPRPTVIDPSPYPAISGLLQEAVVSGLLNPQQSALAQEWQGRIGIILDPSRVDLVNTTLEEAVNIRPDLIGSANLVVDCFGATTYSPLGRRTIQYMESCLLK